jgi:hypothetical protein
MNEYIFNPNSTKTLVSTTNEYYCVKDKEDFLDNGGLPRKNQDSDDVLAKKIIKDGGQPQYYIKVSNINKLYNPVNVIQEEKAYSFLDNVCRPSDRFKSVNSKVFDLYLNFLSTKNTAWLYKAEREMI